MDIIDKDDDDLPSTSRQCVATRDQSSTTMPVAADQAIVMGG